jgi:hypothetical protein
VAGRDITEGRSTRAIAVDVGVVATTAIWQNTDIAYDTAIGGMPFIYAINDARPYIRQTAPFRKEQFDNQTEPGEQSLTGWWIRSQSSFHEGTGITFYDPGLIPGEGTSRFADSKGVDVWTEGEVTLLNNTASAHYTTGTIKTNGKPFQSARSIKYGSTNGILLWDEFDVDKIAADGTDTHFIDYAAGTDYPVHAICDDGVNAYWVTNVTDAGTPRLRVYKKPLTGTSASTADVTLMISDNGITVNESVIEYVKDRLVMAVNNKIYEFATNASALPTATYTHSDNDIVFTSITASGTSIYIAGFHGIQSSIYKFTLNTTTGVMPSLTSAITAAEMPAGEKIYKIEYYLGYMLIGTNKGVRVATVNDDGSVLYGPLMIETSQPVYDFAFRDRFAWAATGVDGEGGVVRIDLGNDLGGLRFAYANDLWLDNGVTGYATTGCSFAGETNRLVFVTAAVNRGTITNKELTSDVATLTTAAAHNLTVSDSIWVEGVDSTFNGQYTVTAATTTTFSYTKAATNVASTAVTAATALVNETGTINIESSGTKMPDGYLQTGFIRYNTLEPKNYKRLLGRGDFTYGSMTLETVDANGLEYDHISYDASVPPIEVSTNQPQSAQEYVAYKFILYRDGTDPSLGPIMKGYQAKATIATPRQRVMRFPVYCYDVETDRYNVQIGYEGRAFERIGQLETIEENGDVVTWQDLTTGESRQCVIEQISFTRLTPPDRGFTGYGGVIEMTIRTV